MKKTVAVLCLVAATLPFWDLGHALWEVDDARYAEVPREMLERGAWITPTLNYVDYIEKPPLIYWLDILSYKALGVSEASARLPLACLSLAGAAAATWLGSMLFAPAIGLLAGLILLTSGQYSLLSHLQTPDMALCVCLAWTIVFFARVTRPKGERLRWPVLAGVSAGLAFLAKGVVGFLFAGLWAAALWALFPAARKTIAKATLISAAAALATAAIWVVPMSITHPDFPRYFFLEQHFMRFATGFYNRGGPWYYFLGLDPAGFLPWTPALLSAVFFAARRRNQLEPEEKALWLWVAGVIGFFSISHSKLPTYILPVFPLQAVLTARFLHRCAYEREAVQLSWAAGWTLSILLGAAALGALLAYPSLTLPPIVTRPLAAYAFIGLLCIAAGMAAIARAHPLGGAWAGAAFTGVLLLGARSAQPFLTAKPLAAALERANVERVISYDGYLHGIPFYSRRPVDVVANWTGELYYAKRFEKFKERFGDDDTIRALQAAKAPTAVLCPAKRAAYAESLAMPRSVVELGAWTLLTYPR